MKCLDPFGRTADVMAGIFEIIAATLSRVARKERGGEGRAVQRCCRPWNAVLPYPKPDVTFVGQ